MNLSALRGSNVRRLGLTTHPGKVASPTRVGEALVFDFLTSRLAAKENETMAEAEFRPVEPFNIDAGELDGLSPQQCFVLGYELADVSRRAELDSRGFGGPVHADNHDRLANALERRGRKFGMTWASDDKSETWMHLWVPPVNEEL